jgi:cell division protein FtsI (penicillin-binding protein 3)
VSKPLDRFFHATPRRRTRKAAVKLPIARFTSRVRVLLILVAVVFSLAAGRAVQVQAIDANNVAAEAADQMTVSHVLPAKRGTITDRNGEVLAQTNDTVQIHADAQMIRTNGRGDAELSASDQVAAAAAPAKIAAILVQYLGGTPEQYLPALTKTGQGQYYQLIAEKVPAATYRQIAAAMSAQKLVGLREDAQPTRVYPNGSLAANLIGFVNGDGVGKGGLELALNSVLAGKDGKEAYESSPNGKIPLGDSALVEPVNGRDIQLTLDAGLQWQVDQILGDRVRQAAATYAMAVVMNPKTGEILALSQYPSFDPNTYGKADPNTLWMKAVTTPYTPGSVQKTLTLSALLDMGLIKTTDIVTVPPKIRSGDQDIQDAEAHGTIRLYVRGVLANSSNIGTIILARKADKAKLHDYYVSFGLGQKTGIGLPGEVTGTLPSGTAPDYARDGAAFGGSAVSTTLLQEASAIAAIANGGVYNPPSVVKSITLPDGTVQSPTTAAPHRVVSEEAAQQTIGMMETMAQQSQSHTFDVQGYRVAAKTGTSKKWNESCKCFRGLVTSAVSVAPVEDPQLEVYVVVDSPQRGSAGVSVAGPAVQDIMSVALTRYGVPQSSGKAPRLPVSPDKLK